jgi:hypothetical protein
MSSTPQPPSVSGHQPQQPPTQPPSGHGYQPQQPPSYGPQPTPPAAKPRRFGLVAVIVIGALAVLAIGGGVAVLAGPEIWYKVGPDTGVRTCKAFAEAGAAAKTAESGDPRPMVGGGDTTFTADEYHDLRGTFEHTRDEELKRYGFTFVDSMWFLLSIKPGQQISPLGYLADIASSYEGLTGACAKHGYTLPPIET